MRYAQTIKPIKDREGQSYITCGLSIDILEGLTDEEMRNIDCVTGGIYEVS